VVVVDVVSVVLGGCVSAVEVVVSVVSVAFVSPPPQPVRRNAATTANTIPARTTMRALADIESPWCGMSRRPW
jgi:hypothetical protein